VVNEFLVLFGQNRGSVTISHDVSMFITFSVSGGKFLYGCGPLWAFSGPPEDIMKLQKKTIE